MTVKLRPVPASQWVTIEPHKRELLSQYGGVAVNDVFLPLWNSDSKIKLSRGSRGSGKSEVVVDKWLDECLTQPYMKGLYGRKIYDQVRGSCFDSFVAGIKKNKLQNYFTFSEANTSSMIITCYNGNKLIPFGSDNASKLKSTKDPTHIWLEEADQFEYEDFMEILPTLRTTRGKNELWMTFNSYAVHPKHWLLKVFYPDQYLWDYNEGQDLEHVTGFFDVASTYRDNYFIDREEYERQLRIASGGSQMIYEGLANGAWGADENKNPWLFNFDSVKHVKELPFLPRYPVYLSFDFNNDPFACTAYQMSPTKGGSQDFVHCIREFSGSYKIEDMCQRIKAAFPASILHVTGDRSGKNAELGRNQTLYQTIAAHLKLNEKLLDLNNTNLEHADSRTLCNLLLANYPNFYIDKSCTNLIRQCSAARCDEKSSKPSQLLKDRGQYKNDEFDSFRYFCQTYFNEFVKRVYTVASR
jgi:phage terminase large subunit